jgi:hypothetical protein
VKIIYVRIKINIAMNFIMGCSLNSFLIEKK